MKIKKIKDLIESAIVKKFMQKKCFVPDCQVQNSWTPGLFNHSLKGMWCHRCNIWVCDKHLDMSPLETYHKCCLCKLNMDGPNPCNFVVKAEKPYVCSEDSSNHYGGNCCGKWFCRRHKQEERYCSKCGKNINYDTNSDDDSF